MARPFNVLTEWWDPTSQLKDKDISPYFWVNGTMPTSGEFNTLVADDFASYRLRVGGLVQTPKEFSYAELKAMPKQEQITTHFAFKGGPASQNGVAFRCVTSLMW
jgi:methionine sulfoxide reductase catalytic subunit